MKKSASLLFFFSIFVLFSCKEKKSAVSGDLLPQVITSNSESGEKVYNAGSFFTPDYRPYDAEEESPAGKLNLSSPSSKGQTAQSVIPGLRKISDYQTSYNEKRQDFVIPQVTKMSEEDSKNASSKNDQPFTLSDWGPKGSIPAEVRYPSFYVLFSEPVVALSAIKEQKKGQDFFTINPPIKGSYRWNGTSLLSFDAEEAVNPLQIYTITLADSIKSLSGKELEGEKSFSTQPAALKIIWSAAGWSKNKWIDKNEVPPDFSKEFRLQFNYPVLAEEIKKISKVRAGKKEIDFTVKQELIDTLTYQWTEDIPFDTNLTVIVEQEINGKKKSTKAQFHTLSPFTFEYENSGTSYGKYTNPVYIYFSHPLDGESVLNALSATNEKGENIPIAKENVEVSGSSLKVFGLNLEFRSKYTLKISDDLKDFFGRKLEAKSGGISIKVDVPGPESKAFFTDSGVRMLESQFPHKLVFEYQNIDQGAYTLTESKNPYHIHKVKAKDWVEDKNNEKNRKNLDTNPRDERIFEVADFDSQLKNGKGWVDFIAALKIPKKPTKWDKNDHYWTTNATSLQVTNLGVSVRYSLNKVVALVTNLSDGKAVEGAKVYAWKNGDDISAIKSKAPSGKSDKNGMAVIELDEKNRASVISGGYWDPPYIYVEKDDDKIIFQPEDHSPWRSGIYSYAAVPNKITEKARIFMFSDRGLYKPGEKLSFRGIDRNQVLGNFIPYEGNFTVQLIEDSWQNPRELGKITGVTSPSGGFYGEFQIPEDTKPGIYKLSYKRDENSRAEEVRINIAFFERLKFQTAISMPKSSIIAGDKIQADLNASYLSGGALSNAKFESNWFREPWYFTSDQAEFNQYTFGPKNTSDGRDHISENSGSLDIKGSSILSCESSGNSIKGAPYRYRVSADVTDISNQQVSTAAATIVHPASFYIGLSKPEMSSSFAKKGEKITFNYKLALTNGKAFTNSKALPALSGKDKKINVKVFREEWNLVQQQGIEDIYSRYEKTDLEESSESINLDCQGKITITPQEPGYHRIQLTSSDKNGRDVITEYEFFVTGSGRCSWYSDDATSIRLTPDKNQYNPGETAHILMESSLPEGNYLITIEREGIFTEEVRHLDGSIHVLDIPVARNYLPVFYVSVSSYSVRQGQPKHEYGSQDLDKPKGYYGAATLFVNPRVKSFTVKMESAKPSYKPGEEAQITLYATKGGKPLADAEITLMAVDRGVLDLINYHVPDPIAFFYNTENFPLQVKGGDSREYLMDPVTYEVKNLKGGDSSDDKIEERSDFNPTALFQPMLKTDENGKVTCSFKLPDTLTTYRLTAFGVNGELLALQEDEIAVQNPINVQQVLPRELRERDTSEIGVLLTNLDGSAHDVSVSVEIQESDKAQAESNGVTLKKGQAFIDGKNEHSVKLPSGTNSTVYFDIAAQKAGILSIVFTIKSDILKERLVCPLKIEKPYVFETVTTTGQLTEKEDSALEKVVIPSFAQDMNGSLSVTLDATRLGLLGQSVNYLFEYPYGCLEQQSSKVLPLVIFEDYIDLFNMDNEVTDIHKCVKSYFKDWKNYQHADGGFGYWPSSRMSDLFVSTRIAHIYALAKKQGYSDKDLAINIEKLCSYIEKEASSMEKKADLIRASQNEYERISLYYNDYTRASAYYVLSLNGRSVSGEKLTKIISSEGQDISALALSGLAALAKEDGKSIAKTAAEKIRKYTRPTTRGIDITNPNAPKWAFACYGDNAENLALSLELFTLLDKDDQINTRLIHSLLSNQRAGYWKNTATTARVLEGIYTVIKTNNLDKTNLSATALFNKEEFAQGTFKGAAAKPVNVSLAFNDEKVSKAKTDTELPLEITKKGKGSLYYTVSTKYALPQELQSAFDGGIGLTMQLYDNDSGEEIKIEADSPLVELESGKTYKFVLNLSSSYDRNFLALRAPIPSGGEILDATFITSPDEASSASGKSEYSEDYDDYEGYFYGGDHYMSNQVIYNGEIQFFWDFFGKGKTSAEFKFRAVRRGVFPTPSATAECMYEPEILGRTGGVLYTIK